MRVIVCGGRFYDDRDAVAREMEELAFAYRNEPLTIVHGACPTGADKLAGEEASRLELVVEPHPAEWGKYGKAAGPIRNRKMLGLGADLVIAFPGGSGTADMADIANDAGVEVYEVKP